MCVCVSGFPGSASGKDVCQWRRHKRQGFDPWVGKIPWRRKWQLAPVFLLGKSHGQRSLGGATVHGVAKSWTQLSAYAHTNTDAYEGVLVLHFVWDEGSLLGEVAFEISGPFWQMIYSRVNHKELQFCRSVVWAVLALPVTSTWSQISYFTPLDYCFLCKTDMIMFPIESFEDWMK